MRRRVRRSAVTVTATGEPTRSDSVRASPGSNGPGMRTGPGGISRRASVASGAEPSLARQPCIRASAAAGTPSAGTVTVAAAADEARRRCGAPARIAPATSACQRASGASSSGVVKSAAGRHDRVERHLFGGLVGGAAQQRRPVREREPAQPDADRDERDRERRRRRRARQADERQAGEHAARAARAARRLAAPARRARNTSTPAARQQSGASSTAHRAGARRRQRQRDERDHRRERERVRDPAPARRAAARATSAVAHTQPPASAAAPRRDQQLWVSTPPTGIPAAPASSAATPTAIAAPASSADRAQQRRLGDDERQALARGAPASCSRSTLGAQIASQAARREHDEHASAASAPPPASSSLVGRRRPERARRRARRTARRG